MSTPEYELTVNIDEKVFPYANCKAQNVYLKYHEELPQDLKYEKPQLSPDEKYIGIIGRGRDQDTLFIWFTSNLEKYKYKYQGQIACFDFAVNCTSFVIAYKKSPPKSYSLSSGKEIRTFESTGESEMNVISSSFSQKSRYYGLATTERFTVWDILKGKVVKTIIDNSPSKYIRKNLLVLISSDGAIKVLQFLDEKEIASFRLSQINSCNDILNCMMSPDLECFYYATRKGIYKSQIKTGKIQLIQEFNKDDTEQVIISSDCVNAISTNMIDIYYWQLGEDKLGTLLKEKFNSLTVDFNTHKVVICDDICINIFDYSEERDEQFIWINRNPKGFESFYFSPDFTVLLAIVDEHNAVVYNTQTGRVIKKWKNRSPEWSLACQIAPITSQTAIIATKSTEDKVKIWNYNNGNEIMTLTGFNSHMFSFSPAGNLLAAGGSKGYEIARVWDLTTGNFNPLNYPEHDNINAIIHLTKEEPYKVIAVAENQKPVVFDVESGKMLYECKSCPVFFDKVDRINSSNKNFFFVQGLTTEKENIAVLFNLENGETIKVYKNCVNIDISMDDKYLLTKSHENNGQLTISNLETISNIRTITCELNPDVSSFLQGNKAIVSPFGKDNKVDFYISDPTNGTNIGVLEFIKKNKEYSEIDLSVDEEENSLILRYIQLS